MFFCSKILYPYTVTVHNLNKYWALFSRLTFIGYLPKNQPSTISQKLSNRFFQIEKHRLFENTKPSRAVYPSILLDNNLYSLIHKLTQYKRNCEHPTFA